MGNASLASVQRDACRLVSHPPSSSLPSASDICRGGVFAAAAADPLLSEMAIFLFDSAGGAPVGDEESSLSVLDEAMNPFLRLKVLLPPLGELLPPPALEIDGLEVLRLTFEDDSLPSSSSSSSSSLLRFSERRSGGGVCSIGEGESLGWVFVDKG